MHFSISGHLNTCSSHQTLAPLHSVYFYLSNLCLCEFVTNSLRVTALTLCSVDSRFFVYTHRVTQLNQNVVQSHFDCE